MSENGRIEITQKDFDYYLGVLPPVSFNKTYMLPDDTGKMRPVETQFGFAEGFEEITAFWMEGDRFYCQKTGRMNTRF